MKYLMIGAGAIGTYLGGSLLSAGKDVAFLEKPEYADSLIQNGVTIHIGDQVIHHAPVTVFSDVKNAFQEEVDVVIFVIKSFDTEDAARDLAPYGDRIKRILCLQNGVENEIVLEKTFGKDKVIGGSVTSSIGRIAAGNVRLEKLRGIGIENRDGLAEDIVRDFNDAGLNAIAYPHRLDLKWSKMLSNLLLNASCAILDMTPLEVIKSREVFHLELRQFKEAVRVMRKLGIKPTNIPRVPIKTLSLVIHVLPDILLQKVLFKPLGGGRGAKMPSLHIDFHQGKTQSEVIFLNGAVSRIGKSVGVPTPVSDAYMEVLSHLVIHPEQMAEYAHNVKALVSAVREKEKTYGG